jgi:hypothetical protein
VDLEAGGSFHVIPVRNQLFEMVLFSLARMDGTRFIAMAKSGSGMKEAAEQSDVAALSRLS